MKQVSIIIPLYNAEVYIAEAISSVLNQSYPNIEIIVVDDGSTDNSASIVKNIQSEKIRLYRIDNSGQCAASNYGISKAKGDYIKFLDADDILHPEHIEQQVKALNGSMDKLASCKWAYFYNNTDHVQFDKEYTHRDYASGLDWFVDSMEKDQGMMGAWLWLIPRPLLDKAGHWDERLSLNNDFDFSARLLAASKGVCFAGGAKIYYRKGLPGALSGTKSGKAFASAILTTELTMNTMLRLENSGRMRRIFADRFQSWIYEFYPQNNGLIEIAENHIRDLGGSYIKPKGGILFRTISSILGWETTRRIQHFAYKNGWKIVLQIKEKERRKKYS